jgi:hypothetical protein
MALPKELAGRAEMLNCKFTFQRLPRFPKIFVRFPRAAGLY